ncbi:hypothetical protein EWM64_g267 [Hericium alpestre]|uniref:Uncharacterized protein n=1 Tax=Hericium alpestre TaxID=135208 RepID=A0A4Z0AAZ6_9AGAM|nr:hypothetical protein EWM64_g267 [Hericium alpestre]
MKRAFGRLWQVLSEDPDRQQKDGTIIPKREVIDEDADLQDETERRVARAPDLTPPAYKLFIVSYANGGPPVFEPSHFAHPEMQLESLEKSLAAIRELQDDGREYVERLEEIREEVGDIRAQRDAVWKIVRTNAVKELQNMAMETAL